MRRPLPAASGMPLNPYITFHSTKLVQTGPDTFDVDGDFTIRGVKKAEKLTLTVTGAGTIQGTMAFDRKQYGMKDEFSGMKCDVRIQWHPTCCGQGPSHGRHETFVFLRARDDLRETRSYSRRLLLEFLSGVRSG